MVEVGKWWCWGVCVLNSLALIDRAASEWRVDG